MKLIPERLVGYRVSNNSMSTNTLRMWQSHNLVIDEFEARHPDCSEEFESNRKLALLCYYYRSLQVRDYRAAFRFLVWSARSNALKPHMRRSFVRSWLRSRLDR